MEKRKKWRVSFEGRFEGKLLQISEITEKVKFYLRLSYFLEPATSNLMQIVQDPTLPQHQHAANINPFSKTYTYMYKQLGFLQRTETK